MRMGIDLSFIRPDHKNGGTEAAIKNLIKGFEQIKETDDVTEIIYFIHRDIYKDYQQLFPSLTYHIYDLKGPHPVRTICFQTFYLKTLVQKEKLDLLYFPTFQTGLRKKWPVPLVVNPNDIQYKYYPEYFSGLKRRYFQLFYSNALKKADSLIAISGYVKKTYKEYFARLIQDKMHVLYVPFAFERAAEEPIEALKEYEGKYILCINSLTKHKNLITLVKAFELLIKNGASDTTPYKLVIGGAAWNGANELADYIKEHDLEKHVILTGYLTDGQLTYLYNHARLFVTPSLYEGFGMTPIEAMAAGCPVISSKETSLYEVTKGLVRYYEPATDAESLCRTMEEELNKDLQSEEEQEKLRICKEAVCCYDKAYVANEYLELFYKTAKVPYGDRKNQTDIYGQLFDEAAIQMKKNGMELPCSKNGYVATVGSGTRNIDVGLFMALDGEAFVDAVWLSCFQKMPDKATRMYLKDKTQRQVLEAAAKEGAFAVRGLNFVGNPYFRNKGSVKTTLFALTANVKNSVFLRKIAKKMPSGLQKKIRKLFC